MHSLLMARINGSPLRVDAESLSPSQCDRLQFQKARHIPSVRKGSTVLASGVLLQERFSARKRGESEKVQRTFDGYECTLSRAQVTFEQDIVEAIEVLVR